MLGLKIDIEKIKRSEHLEIQSVDRREQAFLINNPEIADNLNGLKSQLAAESLPLPLLRLNLTFWPNE